MKRKLIQVNYYQKKLYVRFYNLQKRLRSLIRSGEFFRFSVERQNQMIRRLTILYERLIKLLGKQKLKWAAASVALILSATVAKAGFNAPINISGFKVRAMFPSITFVDLDKDGDKDIVIGNADGTLSYVQNDNGVYNLKTGDASPIDTSVHVGLYAAPAVADIDQDGDYDIAVGDSSGKIFYFKKEAGHFVQQVGTQNPFNSIDVGSFSKPVFVDLDNDGDMDLVVSSDSGKISYFKNNGGTFTEQTGANNPFDSINLGYYGQNITFADIDKDGDYDLFTGSKYNYSFTGYIGYYRNDGGSFTKITGTANPFHGLDIGLFASPAILDVDGDGDLDLVVGNVLSDYLSYFKNDNGTYTEERGTFNPFEGIRVSSYYASPTFADVDKDGDEDIVVGDADGKLTYFQNVGGGFIPVADSASPFDSINVGSRAKPVFVNITGSADPDLVIGTGNGAIQYYEDDSGTYVQKTGTDNPFNGINVGYDAAPVFMDIDGDHDPDLFVGDKYGKISYYQNNAGTFVQQTGTNNPFDSVNVGGWSSPAFADLDYDGDLDLFVGNKYGITYYQNNGGVFTLKTGIDNPLSRINTNMYISPAFADISKKGTLDLYFGANNGQLYFSEYKQAGFTVNPVSEIHTSESGGSSLFSIVLNSQPIDNVQIDISSSDLTEGNVSPMMVTFTSQNWDQPQLITVTGVDDVQKDGNIQYHIDFNVTSFDPEYGGLTIPSLQAVNADNEGSLAINGVNSDAIAISSINKTIVLNMGDNIARKVEVYDIQGNLLNSAEINTTGRFELPMDNAASGIYLVRVYGENNVTNARVMLR